jgi:membrane associated rhomboid family serine protease
VHRIRDAARFPVVTATLAASLVATIAYLTHAPEAEWLLCRATLRSGELWRLVTSALVHSSAMHLAFNAYWLWRLGTRTEEILGSARTLLLFVFLAIGSSAAQYALDAGGVGLSGVGYGLVAYLFVAGRRDPRLRIVDERTALLFAAWGVFCVITTVTGVLRVGNVAHASGALLGAILGTRWRVAAVLPWALALAGAIWLRPYINLCSTAFLDEAHAGYDALEVGRPAAAVGWFTDALRMNPVDAIAWHDLGIAYHRVGRDREARVAQHRAAELDPKYRP